MDSKHPTRLRAVWFLIVALFSLSRGLLCEDCIPEQSPFDIYSCVGKGERYIRLDFVVDEMALVAGVVFSEDRDWNSRTIREFRAQIRSTCAEECSSIESLVQPGFAGVSAILDREEEPYRSCLGKIFSEAKNTPQYPIILSQTLDRLKEYREQWNKNYEASLEFMSRLTGLPFHRSFTVYISHPEVRAGCYMGNHLISWGGSEREQNYTTVYLWHEILHSYLDHTELAHALIEMSADVELMRALNGQEAPLWPGHNFLEQPRKLIENDWKEFVSSRNEPILDFYQRLCKKFPTEEVHDS
jgi:hypothetical protein